MKFIYIFVVIAFIVVLFLGRSIFSSASAVKSSVTSAASGFQGQQGGKKSSSLQSILYLILAVTVVIFILSNVHVYFIEVV
jgi:hypothetical protein